MKYYRTARLRAYSILSSNRKTAGIRDHEMQRAAPGSTTSLDDIGELIIDSDTDSKAISQQCEMAAGTAPDIQDACRLKIGWETCQEAAVNAVFANKIAAIGRDFIALDYQDAASGLNLEMRYPINAIAGVCHMKKKMAVRPGPKKKPAAD